MPNVFICSAPTAMSVLIPELSKRTSDTATAPWMPGWPWVHQCLLLAVFQVFGGGFSEALAIPSRVNTLELGKGAHEESVMGIFSVAQGRSGGWYKLSYIVHMAMPELRASSLLIRYYLKEKSDG